MATVRILSDDGYLETPGSLDLPLLTRVQEVLVI